MLNKRLISLVLAGCMASGAGLPTALADNGMEAKLEAVVSGWNTQNKGTELEIKEIPAEAKEYVKSLPSDVELSLYKRELPDITNKIFAHGYYIEKSDEALPWYRSGTVEEKKQAYIERIKMVDKTVFPDGYTPVYYDTFFTVLGNFVLGGSENIKKANQYIVETLGEDEAVLYHADMATFSFTSIAPYSIWYDYGHLLTPEAKDALYRYICRQGMKNTGFSPYKTSFEFPWSSWHNQSSEGLLMGLVYAEVAGDDRMLKRMEDAIDRTIANMSLHGTGDTLFPGYGGFTYTNYLACYNYAQTPRIKAKLKLLIERMNMHMLDFFHYPSNSLMGTYGRLYGGQMFSIEKQDYRSILYLMMSKGHVFAPMDESLGYGWWPAEAVAHKWYLPEYIENLIINRQYPYTSERAETFSESGDINVHIGNRADPVVASRNSMGYATEEYTLTTSLAQWHTAGASRQNVVMRGTWRRNEDVEDIVHYSDYSQLFSMYSTNTDVLNNPETALDRQIYDYPTGDGKEYAIQNENAAIVMGWPGQTKDQGSPDGYYQLTVDEWGDMGETIMYTNYEESRGIWYGDRFLTGQMQLLKTDKEEVRLLMKTSDMPIELKGNDKIYIEDFNTYVALTPLNTTSLGRTCDIKITEFGKDLFDIGFGSAAAKEHNVLAITAYNYCGEKIHIPYEERIKQRNGFIVEMGDKKEYATISDFKAYTDKTEYESFDEGSIWTIRYKNGEKSMELNVDTETLITQDCYINGEKTRREVYDRTKIDFAESVRETEPLNNHPYGKWDKTEFWDFLDDYPFKDSEMQRTSEFVHSTKTEITLGDAVVKNPSGTAVTLLYDPTSNAYVLLNLANRTAKLTLETPQGTVNIENMNMGKVVYRPGSENEIETDLVPGMTLLETKVSVSGKE